MVILGNAGAGKKTLGNHLVGQDIFKIQSGGTDANCHYKEQRRGNWFYRILTINTISLHTGYCNPLPYIRKHFDKINLIIFAFAYGRYTDECHRSLMCAIQDFHRRAKPFSALVITHCEGITPESRQGIVTEFKSSPLSSKVTAFVGKEIHTVGFPDVTKSSSEFKTLYENGIVEDGKKIRLLVNDCTNSVSVDDAESSFIHDCWESICDFWRPVCGSFRDFIYGCWQWCRPCFKLCCICLLLFPCVLIYVCCIIFSNRHTEAS